MSSVEKQDLGVAGSMNSFARNLGMVIGIALSTTILYRGMSEAYGERVTTYLANRPYIFIVGMRETFCRLSIMCGGLYINDFTFSENNQISKRNRRERFMIFSSVSLLAKKISKCDCIFLILCYNKESKLY